MTPITLTIEREDIDAVERLLLKMKASELSELRRAQAQLLVYGERRASLEGEPASVQARIDILDDLLGQIRTPV